jgi:hypothetical protein
MPWVMDDRPFILECLKLSGVYSTPDELETQLAAVRTVANTVAHPIKERGNPGIHARLHDSPCLSQDR